MSDAVIDAPFIFNIIVSLLPVFLFLAALVLLDSYKLVHLGAVVTAIIAGGVAAIISYFVSVEAMTFLPVDPSLYSKYIAPVIEESLKAAYVLVLLRARKIGFMVDAAIVGFGVGAGFAFIENVYYLHEVQVAGPVIWIVRGLGTAVMHGGTTAILSVLAKSFSSRHQSAHWRDILPGLVVAFIIHSVFNHFFLPPLVLTVVLLITFPVVLMVVFQQSEKATRQWLKIGLDTDLEILEMITKGNISETNIGSYFRSLQSRFPGEVIADMLCLLRIHIELSIRAKGVLMMKKIGFKLPHDPDIKEKFEELRYLQRAIGKTGQIAMAPLIHTSSNDLWQIHMLERI